MEKIALPLAALSDWKPSDRKGRRAPDSGAAFWIVWGAAALFESEHLALLLSFREHRESGRADEEVHGV